MKLQRDGEARAGRRGPTLYGFSLSWLDRYAGSGHDSVRANTRREYRRLLVTFALTYFDREVRVRDIDRTAVQQFVDWLTTRPGRAGRLCDRSIANALTPLRLVLDAAVAEGLLDANPADQVVLPRRRAGPVGLVTRPARTASRRNSVRAAAADHALPRVRPSMMQNSRTAGSSARAASEARRCSRHADWRRRPPLPRRTQREPRRASSSCSASASTSGRRSLARRRTTMIARSL
jgi:hypothetical protein